MKELIHVVVISAIIISLGCNKMDEQEKANELAVIAKTIESNIAWFKNKDFDLLLSTVVHDSTYLSVHPRDNIVCGYDEFVKNLDFFKYQGFQYVRHELKDLTIHLSQDRNVAWWYCILDDINTWDGQPASWENTRWTGVLEKRDGHWAIVQQHFSFAQE